MDAYSSIKLKYVQDHSMRLQLVEYVIKSIECKLAYRIPAHKLKLLRIVKQTHIARLFRLQELP
jgi:hypothetical protein